MPTPIWRRLLVPVLVALAILLGAGDGSEYRVCVRNASSRPWILRVAGAALDGPNAASTFRLRGRGCWVPLGGEATSSPWLVLPAQTYDVIIRCLGELACRIELDDGNGNGRVLALAGSPGRTLVQAWHHGYASSRDQPMVWMPAGWEDKVIDLVGEIQGEAGPPDSPAFRLITILRSAYPCR